ncbi:MAG: beta-aspartyl-peptidase [Armatimonadetes bacterium]|nr:beta-aspartyl-peptidase [Armatimonadota bacterium]
MLTLLRRCQVWAPQDLGTNDILIAGGRVAAVASSLPAAGWRGVTEIDCGGRVTVPGFVDGHTHFLGGGGSTGPHTRGPELNLTDFTRWGTTTAVGLLGADGLTRSLVGLLAKARALEDEGLSTYLFIGCYDVPPPTITGSLKLDVMLIEKALGAGEIAISDPRSSQPTVEELVRIAAETQVAGRLTGRGGVVNIHMGLGKAGLQPLIDAHARSDLPAGIFLPTHCNRTAALLDQTVAWALAGNPIDLTAHRVLPGNVWVPDAVAHLLSKGVPIDRISMSTDAGGVFPHLVDAHGKPAMAIWETRLLYDEFRDLIVRGMPIDVAVRIAATNPARHLRLHPRKGEIAVGSDADLLVLGPDWEIDKVLARGRLMVDGGNAIVKGVFEER